MDSDGSVMEGNDIEDLGGGAFRTNRSTEKYSRLDMYAMGLATDAEVPRWFFIDSPISNRDRENAPLSGVTSTAPAATSDTGCDRRAWPARTCRGRLAAGAPAGIRVRATASAFRPAGFARLPASARNSARSSAAPPKAE